MISNEESVSPELARHLGRVLDATSSEIYYLDADTLIFVRANRAALANVGYSLEELRTLGPWDISPGTDAAALKLRAAKLLSGEISEFAHETVHRRKDGTTYDVDLRLMFSHIDGRDMIVGIAHDITDRRAAEAALRKRVREMEVMASFRGRLVEATTSDEIIATALDTLSELFETPRVSVRAPEEFHGTRSIYAGARGLSERYQHAMGMVAFWDRGSEFSVPLRLSDVPTAPIPEDFRRNIIDEGIGALLNCSMIVSGRMMGSINVYYDQPRPFADEEVELAEAIAADLGLAIERLLALRALQASERAVMESQERLTLATRGTDLTVWDADLELGTTLLEGSLAAVLGLKDGVPTADVDWAKRVHPDDRMGLGREWRALLKGDKSFHDYEYRIRARSGEWLWVQSRARVAERASTGRATRAVGTYLDVTGRKQAEFALQASEARARELATIVESAPSAMFTFGNDGAILTWNRGAEGLFGYPANEIIGRKVDDLLTDEFRERAIARPAVERGEVLIGVEYRGKNRDGAEIELEASFFPIRNSEGRASGYACTAQDVGDRKRQAARNLLLAQLANMVNNGEPAESLFSAALESLPQALEVDYLGFVEALPGGELIRVVGSRPEVVVPDGSILPRQGTGVEWLGNQRNVVEYRTDRVETPAAALLREAGIIRMAAVAARDGEELLGEFTVGRGEGERYTPEEREFILMLGHLLGQALGNRRRAELRLEAETALRDNEQKYRTLFENAQVGMFRLRVADARLIEANDRLSAMAGYTSFEAMPEEERQLFRVLPELDRAEQLLHQLVATGEIDGADIAFRQADGSPGTARVSARLEPGGEVAEGVAVDVSDEVAARVAILALNADLERRVDERTAELQQALADLESFSYTVSHDLRAPLRAIQGFSQAALREVGPELGERGTHLIDRVIAGTNRMSSLIDGLLVLARVSRATLNRARLDLSTLAATAAAEAIESQPGTHPEVRIGEGVFARGDRALVSVILQNLFENAVKFSRCDANPVIEFGCAESASEKQFYVRDNGVGFEQEYADRMFRPFQRLHTTSEFEGTGIGLATVERIVQRHGGRVWAEGRKGQGATIYFTLQAGAPP